MPQSSWQALGDDGANDYNDDEDIDDDGNVKVRDVFLSVIKYPHQIRRLEVCMENEHVV